MFNSFSFMNMSSVYTSINSVATSGLHTKWNVHLTIMTIVSVQMVSTPWHASVLLCLYAHRVRGHTLVEPPVASPLCGHWCTVGILAGTHQWALQCPSRMASGAERQPCVIGVVSKSWSWCACSLCVHVCLGILTPLLDGLRWHKLAIVCVSSSRSVWSS